MPRRKVTAPAPAPQPAPATRPSSPASTRTPKTAADPHLLAAISALLEEYTSCVVIETTWDVERARFAAAIDKRNAELAQAQKGRAA